VADAPIGILSMAAAHYHFRKWRHLNLPQRPTGRIWRSARVAEGQKPSPSATAGDTQSADTEQKRYVITRLLVL
jgi:hypothetical protein